MFTALLDTCVLVPSKQRDFLLSLAVEGMYRPAWSWRVLEELEYTAIRLRTRRGDDAATARQYAKHLLSQMSIGFADAEVQGWEPLEGSYGLPDPDDEHLVAAAVIGGAGMIVTNNVRDLPADKIPKGIEVQPPDTFAWNTVSLAPRLARLAVEKMGGAHRSCRPS